MVRASVVLFCLAAVCSVNSLPKDLCFNLNDDPQCNICKSMIDFIKEKFTDPTTELAGIQRELTLLCQNLEYEDSLYCTSLLDSHLDVLVNMVTAEFTGEEMCRYLKHCRTTSSLDEETNTITIAQKDEGPCEICELIFKTLEITLQDPKTKEEIRDTLEMVCTLMPETIQSQCKEDVDKYTDLIITLLAQVIQPDQICKTMGMCAAVEKTNIITESKKYEAKLDVSCSVCRLILNTLKKLLKKEHTKAQIERAIKQVCHLMPKSKRTKCNRFLNKYSDLIIAAVMSGSFHPRQLCHKMGVCSSINYADIFYLRSQ